MDKCPHTGKFLPGNTAAEKYDLAEEAKSLEEWSKKPESKYLGDWVLERDFDPDNVSLWARKNVPFSEALKKAKLRIASRLRKSISDPENPYNYGLFMREIGMYDRFLNQYERKEKRKDVKDKMQEQTIAAKNFTSIQENAINGRIKQSD